MMTSLMNNRGASENAVVTNHVFQSYLKCQIIGANELLDQQEVAFSKHMHMAT